MEDDMTRKEIEALVNLRQFSGETRVKTNKAITQLLAQLDAANLRCDQVDEAWAARLQNAYAETRDANARADAAAEQMRERCAVEAAKRAKFTRVAIAAATASEIFANIVSVTQTKTANKIEELIRALPLYEEQTAPR